MKKAFDRFIDRFVKKPQSSVPAGMYTAQPDPKINLPYRMHLRVETDGSGILILNASTILHLNQTAVEYSYALMTGMSATEAAKKVSSFYAIDETTAEADYADFKQRIETLLQTPDLDPITFLDFERAEPYSATLSAPYRLDCALTYRVRDDLEPEVAPTDRVDRELSSEEWLFILKKAWQAGIPHVIFTGGEPTLRPDLCELIEGAEQIGLVTGLMTDGKAFTDKKYLRSLLNKGLDHVTLLAEPDKKEFWSALEKVMAEDIHVTVHLTVQSGIKKQIFETLTRLSKLAVGALSLSMTDISAQNALQAARQKAAELGLRLVWDLPVPYSRHNPVAVEAGDFGETLPEGAGQAWLYVEPDGDVLPAQGINRVLGNWLTDEWKSIAAAR